MNAILGTVKALDPDHVQPNWRKEEALEPARPDYEKHEWQQVADSLGILVLWLTGAMQYRGADHAIYNRDNHRKDRD